MVDAGLPDEVGVVEAAGAAAAAEEVATDTEAAGAGARLGAAQTDTLGPGDNWQK